MLTAFSIGLIAIHRSARGFVLESIENALDAVALLATAVEVEKQLRREALLDPRRDLGPEVSLGVLEGSHGPALLFVCAQQGEIDVRDQKVRRYVDTGKRDPGQARVAGLEQEQCAQLAVDLSSHSKLAARRQLTLTLL
jgi:hypothetical protein